MKRICTIVATLFLLVLITSVKAYAKYGDDSFLVNPDNGLARKPINEYQKDGRIYRIYRPDDNEDKVRTFHFCTNASNKKQETLVSDILIKSK